MTVGSFARLLSALSAECDELAFRVEDMHRLIGIGGVVSDDTLVAAQDIDFVWQHLASLSQFLMQVAEMTPNHLEAEIDGPLQSVRLADLRRRLSGESEEEDANRVRPGELELL